MQTAIAAAGAAPVTVATIAHFLVIFRVKFKQRQLFQQRPALDLVGF
jgi:hypothetical protein